MAAVLFLAGLNSKLKLMLADACDGRRLIVILCLIQLRLASGLGYLSCDCWRNLNGYICLKCCWNNFDPPPFFFFYFILYTLKMQIQFFLHFFVFLCSRWWFFFSYKCSNLQHRVHFYMFYTFIIYFYFFLLPVILDIVILYCTILNNVITDIIFI